MKPEAQVLAVDLGTSGCKAALATLRGEVRHWAFAPVDTLLSPGGGAEQRPADWTKALETCAAMLRAEAPSSVKAVEAVCCNTQGEGTVAVDAQGAPLMNAILWMDQRGAEPLRGITRGMVEIAGYHPSRLWRWIRLTGGAPSHTGKDPAGHMLLVRDHFPEVYEATHKFLNVLDYMNHWLTGRFVATHDSVLTSWVTDNRDPGQIRYHPALLRQSGIDAGKFPELAASTAVIGGLTKEAARALGLRPGLPVVAGAIDNSAAAVGSGAVGNGEVHGYLGTSSWLAAHVPYMKTDIHTGIASVPCAIPGKYLLTALQAAAGSNLEFLRGQILFPEEEGEDGGAVFERLNALAEASPAGSRGLLYLPWIYGERAPVEDRNLRAAFFNLSLENSRGDLVRAVLEGVALNTRWLVPPVERFLGHALGPVRLVGGGAASDPWCAIHASVLGVSILRPEHPIQANVRGAALIAAVGLGALSYDEVPACVPIEKEFIPRPEEQAVYHERFEQFVAFHKQNRGLYRSMNQG